MQRPKKHVEQSRETGQRTGQARRPLLHLHQQETGTFLPVRSARPFCDMVPPLPSKLHLPCQCAAASGPPSVFFNFLL